jgi:hypothetical protein
MTDLRGFAEALLTGSDYNPYLARVRFNPQLGWYLMLGSPDAFEFIQLAYGTDGKIDSADALLDDEPWSRSTRRAYFELGASDRSDVMAFVCVTLHELIHNGDLLTTPTGAVFHTHLSAIARALHGVTRWIVDDPDFDCAPPATQWAPSRPKHRAMVESLLTFEEFFRQMRKVRPADVRPGWTDGAASTATLLGGDFSLVTLFGSVNSVEIPGHDGWYVTPATILEGRALSACVLRLLHLLGDDDPARVFQEVSLFLRTYYPRPTTSPDYYFFLDIASGAFGLADFDEALVKGRRIEQVAQLPRLVLAVGWWALHGADPVEGAVLSLAFLQGALGERRNLGTPEEVCAQIEAWVGGLTLQQRADRASLLVEHARQLIRESECDAHIGAHFEHVFEILERHLRLRVMYGWRFPLCSPPRGTPFPYLEPQHQRDLGGTYNCPARFEDWVDLREEICHRWRTVEWKHAVVHRWLSGQRVIPVLVA